MRADLTLQDTRGIIFAGLADAASKIFIEPSLLTRYIFNRDSSSSTTTRFTEDYQKVIRQYPSLGFQYFHIDEVYRDKYSLYNSSEVIIGVKERPRQGEIITDPANIASNKAYFPKAIKDFILRKLKEFPDCTVFVHSYAMGQNAAQRAVAELNRKGFVDRLKCVSVGAKAVSSDEFQTIALGVVQENITSLVFREDWQEGDQAFANIKLFDRPRRRFYDVLNLNSNYGFVDMVKAGETARMNELRRIPNSLPPVLGPKILNIPAEDVNFSGFSIDASGSYLLSTSESLNLPRDSGTTLNYLATALLIYYDESATDANISNKKISVSLEPCDDNPTCDFKKIQFFPDNENLSNILKNTEYFRVLLDCDLLMKSLSMDRDYEREDLRPMSQSLRRLGLKPIHEFGLLPPNFSVRLLLKISNIKAERRKNENLERKCFIVNEIAIEVVATELVRDTTSGEMKEVKIEDRKHPACLFAAKFTELYEEISKEHSVFARLKQIAKANVLAKWAFANCIPISIDKVRELLTRKIISPAIPEKIKTLSHRILRGYGFSNVIGGINVEVNSFYSLLERELKLGYTIPTIPDSLQLLITETSTQVPISGLLPFPFVDLRTCTCCNDVLSHLEACYVGWGPFCKDHNSKICRICYKHIIGDPTRAENDCFHAKCIKEEAEFRDMERLSSVEELFEVVTINTRSMMRRTARENEARVEEAVGRVHEEVDKIYSWEDCRYALEMCGGVEKEALRQLLETSLISRKRNEAIRRALQDNAEFFDQLAGEDKEKIKKLVDSGYKIEVVVEVFYQHNGDYENMEQALQALQAMNH